MEYDLSLIALEREEQIPTAGKGLIIVANVNGHLHFRVFDSHGEIVQDSRERELLSSLQELDTLKNRLRDLWGNKNLPHTDRKSIVDAVNSLLSRSGSRQESAGNISSSPQEIEGWSQDEMEAAKPFPLPEIPDDKGS